MLENYKFYTNKAYKKLVFNTLEPAVEFDYYKKFEKEELIFFVLDNNCIDQYGIHYAKILVDGAIGYVEIIKDRLYEFDLVCK